MEDKIAIVALIVAFISAGFAGFSWWSARNANRISIETALRSDRKELYRLARRFTRFCSQYPAQLTNGAVKGSDALNKKRELFVQECDEIGPVGIPWLDGLVREISGHAEEMQRTIDAARSLAQEDGNRGALKYSSEVVWFGEKHTRLKQDFEPYLEIGGTTKSSSGRGKFGGRQSRAG